LVEAKGARILVDPGSYAFADRSRELSEMRDLTAVLITHEHNDHASVDALKLVLEHNRISVYGPGSVQKKLAAAGIASERLEDRNVMIGDLGVEVMTGLHADGPFTEHMPNNAYCFDHTLLVPGDCYDERLTALAAKALAFPMTAGWRNESEGLAFLKKISPAMVIPVHDGFVMPKHRRSKQEQWAELCGKMGMKFFALEGGEDPIEI
jgi:L-ascorbate metabolism protein UlaG (beta-lactamase superfamily)